MPLKRLVYSDLQAHSDGGANFFPHSDGGANIFLHLDSGTPPTIMSTPGTPHSRSYTPSGTPLSLRRTVYLDIVEEHFLADSRTYNLQSSRSLNSRLIWH